MIKPLLLFIGVLISSIAIGESSSINIPEARKPSLREQEYGRTVAAEISKEFSLDPSFEHAERVREILKKIIIGADGNPDDWTVFVFKSPRTKNITAIRGNTIFVWTGMLLWLKNDSDLAAALSHEIAHVLLEHDHPIPNPQIKIKEILSSALSTGAQIGTSLAGAGGIASGFAAEAAGILSDRIFEEPGQTKDEIEADKVSVLLMERAQFDSHAVMDLWKRAERDPNLGGDPIPFYALHPTTSERIKSLKEFMSSSHDKAHAPLATHWVVGDRGADVYVSPSDTAEIRTKLPSDTNVEVEETFGSWFFVVSPTHGYIKGVDLRPSDNDSFDRR